MQHPRRRRSHEILDCDLVWSCCRAALAMNVTVKLPDKLCREARHCAVDESKSLSAWVADLISRELKQPPLASRKSLLEMLGDPATADRDFDLPDRKADRPRKITFP